MNELVFSFNSEVQVRTTTINNEPYFSVSDVGQVLGLSNAYRQIKDYTKGVHTMQTLTKGGNQNVTYISESNLYRLIFKSRKKEAKEFQDWIMEVVIPSIRKTGSYGVIKSLKSRSTEDRKVLTEAWEKSGIEKKHHFIQLTLQEYKALGFDKGKRKKDLDRGELLALNALESMEALKLFNTEKEGYYECRDSIHETSQLVDKVNRKEIGE